MKNQKNLLIGLFVVLVIANIFFAYLIFFNHPKYGRGNFEGSMPMNMELADDEVQSIISFFQSTTDSNEIESYCQSNRMYCMYYCINFDSGNEICNQMQNFRQQFNN